MKIRTTKFVLKEGLVNFYKNKLMSIASVSIVTASLLILGIFILITINLNYNLKIFTQQPEMEVFCDHELDDSQIMNVENYIKNNDKIKKYIVITKEEAYDKAKEILGDNQSVLDGVEKDFLPVSFKIFLKDSKQSQEVVKDLSALEGVSKVSFSQKQIEFVWKITYWIQIISVVSVMILLVISMFIIANTIKLAVFARRKEINIMKYIGATDWFIKWPFIIEGIVIGLCGALISVSLILYGYNYSVDKLSASLEFINFVKISDVGINLILSFSITGTFIGALGSMLSIRKYLKV